VIRPRNIRCVLTKVSILLLCICSKSWSHDSPFNYAAALDVVDRLDCKKLAESADSASSPYVDDYLLRISEAFTDQRFESKEAAKQYMENNVPKAERDMILAMTMPRLFSCLGAFVDKAFAKELPETNEEKNTQDEVLITITDRIVSQWRRPIDYTGGLEVNLRLDLSRDGNVIDIRVSNSSGNFAFDQSAVRAVKKAEPFKEIAQFNLQTFEDTFKTLTIKFAPKD